MNSSSQQIRRALVSVSDKTGIASFAGALADRGIALISTGGTARVLAAGGLPVTEVATVTGVTEFLDGRVKTLHPAIHGGLLARRDRPDHLIALGERGIVPIDLLVCNLYPFAETVAAGASREECIENIDIGGVALIRAAAKNHDAVTVVADPADYDRVLAEIAAGGGAVGAALRRSLAGKAYAATAAYDAAIAEWMARAAGESFPETLVIAGRLAQRLRYGENPHQAGALYHTGEARPGAANARQLQGKELSYNNYADADAAFELVAELAPPAVAIIKHANPCGVALGATLREAWDKALAGDPVSAFGGVVALNHHLDMATAEAIGRLFVEVVIAPQVEPEAAALLARKTALRLLVTDAMPDPLAPGWSLRSVAGGILMQQRDALPVGRDALRSVTRRAPSEGEIGDLLFADRVAKHVKSNAIVFVRDGATVGIGAGQPSRVDSVRIAAQKAEDAGKAAGLAQSPTQGSVVASDAFFPFADGLEAAIAAGATAVIQPGGSVRDAEVIAAADAAGIAMVFTAFAISGIETHAADRSLALAPAADARSSIFDPTESVKENSSMRHAISTAAAMLALASVLLPATPALAGYGAIAWDRDTGKRGWSWNQSTARKAAEVALSECGASGCKVIIHTATAGCAALATTADGKFVGAAARKTQDEARLAALANCQKGKAGDCIVRVSDCNK